MNIKKGDLVMMNMTGMLGLALTNEYTSREIGWRWAVNVLWDNGEIWMHDRDFLTLITEKMQPAPCNIIPTMV